MQEKSQQEKEQIIASLRERIEALLGQTLSGIAVIASDDDGQAAVFADFRSFGAVKGTLEGISQVTMAISSALEDGKEA